MTVDARAFRHALGQFASGITVVTTRDHGGQLLGLTVSAFCSVSLHPPLVLVCVDARSETHAAFVESKVFGVSPREFRRRRAAQRADEAVPS